MSSKVGIVSLGCPKNQVDAEMLLFTLKSKGFELVNDPADADAVIVNTCGFIESAKQENNLVHPFFQLYQYTVNAFV